jgi:hypothetical protein
MKPEVMAIEVTEIEVTKFKVMEVEDKKMVGAPLFEITDASQGRGTAIVFKAAALEISAKVSNLVVLASTKTEFMEIDVKSMEVTDVQQNRGQRNAGWHTEVMQIKVNEIKVMGFRARKTRPRKWRVEHYRLESQMHPKGKKPHM